MRFVIIASVIQVPLSGAFAFDWCGEILPLNI